MPTLAEETKILLARLGVPPRKRWGQHFMIQREVLGRIADALETVPGEPVLEIGPGLGFLTRELTARGAAVTAVETDPKLARHLSGFLPGASVRVVQGDILSYDPDRDPALPAKVAGNIPYNITTPILEWLIDRRATVRRAVLTTQWELAQRIAGRPGSREWGPISLFCQAFAEVRLLEKIPRGSFWPAPKVDSAVLRLDFTGAARYGIVDEERFFRIVRKAFQKRRKTLLNALESSEGGFPKAFVLKKLNEAGIDAARRPETLAMEEWARLAAGFGESGGIP